MKGTFHSQYRSGNGNLVNRYIVTGTPEEMVSYKKAQGENLRYDGGDENRPMFFSTRDYGQTVELLITSKGTVSAIDGLDSLKELVKNETDPVLKALFAQKYVDAYAERSFAKKAAPVQRTVETDTPLT